MKKAYAIVAAAGLALAPWALAQAPAGQPAAADQPQAAAQAVVPAAQQATKQQLIKLFEVMRLRQQFTSMTKMMPAIVQQQVHEDISETVAAIHGGNQLTTQQQAALEKIMTRYMEKASSIYPADEMANDAMAVYQRHMSRSDVDAYIAFYSSPPGQRLLDAQPVIMHEYMPIVREKVKERTHKLYAEMAQDLHEFVKAQAPAKTPAPKSAQAK